VTLRFDKSAKAFDEAKQYLPGGVNSPVRSLQKVGGTPPFIARGTGCRLYDIDGNSYIDYVGSWGPMILGHAHPAVIQALREALPRGTSYGAPTLLETELAKLITGVMPSVEMIRMVNSGTEATMSALRLARAYTRRSKILKFVGCYHGHHDSLLVKAGSGAATFGVPDSPGVPEGIAADTITVSYNDIEALENVFFTTGDKIAAVIIEPVAGNMGLVLPKAGYLNKVSDICKQYGALLIFDEVMCGFRAAFKGAQSIYGVAPDITCLGKVIGGGLPIGAYGGRRDIMKNVSPSGPVYQAGTLSGNPLAMTAGIATLRVLLENPDIFTTMAANAAKLCDGLRRQAENCGLPVQIHQIGTMFCIFFSQNPVCDYESAVHSDTRAFGIFYHEMLSQGIYLAPSQFETLFMSAAHTSEDIAATIDAGGKAFARVASYKGTPG
jgi:glutamate-1-semialdehyde 2,1-aminomutase